MNLLTSPLGFAAALVLAGVSPAFGLEIRFLRDDPARLSFEVAWGIIPQDPLELEVTSLAGSAAWCGDLPGGGISIAVTDSLSIDDAFFLRFGGADRSFATATVEGFEGTQAFPVTGNPFAATFVYREPLTPPVGMVDEAQTLGLITTGTLAAGLLRRFPRRWLSSHYY